MMVEIHAEWLSVIIIVFVQVVGFVIMVRVIKNDIHWLKELSSAQWEVIHNLPCKNGGRCGTEREYREIQPPTMAGPTMAGPTMAGP